MKPPARKRTKPNINPYPEPVTSTQAKLKWQRAERRKLLNALKRLRRTAGGNSDIDYASLKKSVPSRSTEEIQGFVETLKDKVISHVGSKLKKKKWEDKKAAKPIEVWTHLASSIAGKHEATIFTAFSQVLIVSSTEPCTLRNCDPPQVYRPPADESSPIGRTVPFRPLPRLPVPGERPGTNATCSDLVVKTQVSTTGPNKTLQAPTQVVSVPNIKVPPQQQPSTTALSLPTATSTSQSAATSRQKTATKPSTSLQSASQIVKPLTSPATPCCGCTAGDKTQTKDGSTQRHSEQQPTSLCNSCASKLTSCSSSVTTVAPVSSAATSSVACSSSATSTHPAPPLSTPAKTYNDKFVHTSKCATKDNPRTFGVKWVVDFERIYRFLSVIHKPNTDCHLTPMESAIVLDLLMSLPDEISLLNCHKLHKHLVQMYQCLSAPADCKITREKLKNLRDRLSGQTERRKDRSSTSPDTQQDTAGPADSTNVADSGRETLQPSEAEHPESKNTNSQSGEADIMEPWPLLNPFLVPLKLLKRK